MAMRKRFAPFVLVCLLGLLVIAPAAGASGYPVPKPKGGTKVTKKPTKNVGKKIQHTAASKLGKGFKITVFLPKAGKMAVFIKHNGARLGSGVAKGSKKGNKKLQFNFNPVGKNFLKEGANKKVTIRTIFTPKHGKTITSSATVTVG